MLPPLPQIKKKREQSITPKVMDWFLKYYPNDVALEIKIKGGKIYPHQIVALKQVRDGNFKYKIPDTGKRNPFDCIVLKRANAFLVICDKNMCEVFDPDKQWLFNIKI